MRLSAWRTRNHCVKTVSCFLCRDDDDYDYNDYDDDNAYDDYDKAKKKPIVSGLRARHFKTSVSMFFLI